MNVVVRDGEGVGVIGERQWHPFLKMTDASVTNVLQCAEITQRGSTVYMSLCSWNYRIVERIEHGVPTWGLYEVYYDEDNVPSAMTEEVAGFWSDESPDNVVEQLKIAIEMITDDGNSMLHESDFLYLHSPASAESTKETGKTIHPADSYESDIDGFTG